MVGTAHKPGIPATQTLGRQRRSSQNALQSLDLDTEPGDHDHRDRYTTSTGMTAALCRRQAVGAQQDGKDTDAELGHRFAEFVARERALLGVGESGERPRDAEPVVISGAVAPRLARG